MIDFEKPIRIKNLHHLLVRLLCTDAPGNYPVCGLIINKTARGSSPSPMLWNLDGISINGPNANMYLENYEPPPQEYLWSKNKQHFWCNETMHLDLLNSITDFECFEYSGKTRVADEA